MFAFFGVLGYNKALQVGSLFGRPWVVANGSLTLSRLLHDAVGTLGGNMVIRDQAELRLMLEVERERLQLVLGHGASSTTESIGYGNHMADDATEAFEQARDMSVRARLGDTLIDVEEALHKFDLGSYAICEDCGNKIDWARLEAKPAARLCIKCQRRSDFGR